MPELCGKCDVAIGQTKMALKCTECNGHFHLECTRSVSDERVSTRKSWKCDGCYVENASNASSKTGADNYASVLDAIAEFRLESKAKWDESIGKLNKMQLEIEKVRDEIGTINSDINEVKVKTQQNSDSVVQLRQDNFELNEKLQALTKDMCNLQQHTRKNNLLITGVPSTKGECVLAILANLAKLLNIKYYDSDVSAAHRLPNRRGDNRPPSIVVNFISRAVKIEWIGARKRRGTLSANELRSGFPDSPIYLNEHLTPQTREVFNRAREMLRSKKLAFVWTTDCRVLVKKTEKGPTKSVLSLDDLRQFIAPVDADASQQVTT